MEEGSGDRVKGEIGELGRWEEQMLFEDIAV
jgi:hypothetical protein